MLKITRWFIWGLFSLLLLTAIDQILLRVDVPVPGYTEVHAFYIDFRSRLLRLTGLTEEDTIAEVINANKNSSPAAKTTMKSTKPAAAKPTRYLYVDKDGALQFVDQLDQVPLQYRRDAQPLAE